MDMLASSQIFSGFGFTTFACLCCTFQWLYAVTSKFHDLIDMDAKGGTFGFRGEALASISDVSLVEIITRACGRANGYRKVLKVQKVTAI